MPILKIRYIGDKSFQPNVLRAAFEYTLKSEKIECELDFDPESDRCAAIDANPQRLLEDLRQQIAEVTSWMRFDALILDLNWSSLKDSEFAGLEIIYDGLLAAPAGSINPAEPVTLRRTDPPWGSPSHVYICTIHLAKRESTYREKALRLAAARDIPHTNIFCAGPDGGPNRLLAQTVIRDWAKNLNSSM